MKAYQLLLAGCVLLLSLQPPLAVSQENQPQNSLLPSRARAQDDEPRTRISRREASDIARASYEGRVVSIRLERLVWRVRIDMDGSVVDVLVNSDTGAVSRPSE
jgi:uncharacterized membrane protein YkoI